MLAATAANREYWEARNRERLAMIAATPPSPARTALYAKLAEQRARRLREEAGTCREAQTRLTDS
ncbi:MAG: hypothetical protein IVW57_16010 [Ktedonobacterales bacterium]|nr:hypothetical protein [Ktedonobacterales bacterium]